MRIVVTSQNFRTVSGHAGRATRFLIYQVSPDGEPQECARFDLSPQQSFHEMQGVGAHPIDGANVILSAGFGAHFKEVMARRGIQAAVTDKTDPLEAVRDYLARRAAGTLLPSAGCECGGDCHGDADG